MLDFLDQYLPLVPEGEASAFHVLIHEASQGKSVPLNRLRTSARALATWVFAPRVALKAFTKTNVGIKAEWDLLLEHARPATVFLLARLQAQHPDVSVGEALSSTDAAYLIHDEQEMELKALCPEILILLWQAHKKTLQKEVDKGQNILKDLERRLRILRLQASQMDEENREQGFARIDRFEDRIYFGAEVLPLEMLDQEIAANEEQLQEQRQHQSREWLWQMA